EQGNLLGWNVFNEANLPGSAGNWVAATGTTSPLSTTSVPAPSGNYQAMVDENNLIPYTPSGNNNPNSTSSYSGSHALYQDVTIPANATSANFSMSLYINNTGLNISGVTYSDPTVNSSLDFNTPQANQQVRVDIMQVNQILNATTDPSTGWIAITS